MSITPYVYNQLTYPLHNNHIHQPNSTDVSLLRQVPWVSGATVSVQITKYERGGAIDGSINSSIDFIPIGGPSATRRVKRTDDPSMDGGDIHG